MGTRPDCASPRREAACEMTGYWARQSSYFASRSSVGCRSRATGSSSASSRRATLRRARGARLRDPSSPAAAWPRRPGAPGVSRDGARGAGRMRVVVGSRVCGARRGRFAAPRRLPREARSRIAASAASAAEGRRSDEAERAACGRDRSRRVRAARVGRPRGAGRPAAHPLLVRRRDLGAPRVRQVARGPIGGRLEESPRAAPPFGVFARSPRRRAHRRCSRRQVRSEATPARRAS